MSKYSKEIKQEIISCACGCGKTLERYKKNFVKTKWGTYFYYSERKCLRGHAIKRIFVKGFVPWNKNKSGYHIHTEEEKKRISARFKGRRSPMKGRRHSELSKKAIGEGNRNKFVSTQQRKNISVSKMGKKNPMYGKTHSDSYKERLKIQWTETGHPPNWKGGVTSETNLRVSNSRWKKIKIQVYKRDNYFCQNCGVKCVNGKHKDKKRLIQCHHIIPWRISKDDSLKNLITFCLSCHSKIEWKFPNGKGWIPMLEKCSTQYAASR